MTEGPITYANATSQQQKIIDATIVAVGSDPEVITEIGVGATDSLLKLSTELFSQADLGAAPAKASAAIDAYLKDLPSDTGVVTASSSDTRPEYLERLQDSFQQILKSKKDILVNGEKIKKFTSVQNAVDQDLQLTLAVVNEIEHRMMHGSPSAEAKYDLNGPDTRGFAVNFNALKKEFDTTGSAKAEQNIESLLNTVSLVKMKGDQFKDTLGRHARDMKVLKEASHENARNLVSITNMEGKLVDIFTTHTAQSLRPAPKAGKPDGHKPA